MTGIPINEELREHFIEDKNTIENISKLSEIIELLGSNPRANIDIIIQHTYKLLQGVYCLYNRLDDLKKSLIAWSTHNLPPDFNREDSPYGHICYEATIKGKDKPVIIEDLGSTVYQKTDPNVNKYGLKSYLGFPVLLKGKTIGSLCIVDIKKRKFSSTEINIISTSAKAVSLEEERKHVEVALQKSREKYRSLVENIPDVTWTTDNQGNTTFISQNIKEVYGFTPEEIYKEGDRLWLGRIHADDIEKVETAYMALFEKRIHFDIEYRIQKKNGKWIWAHDRAISTYKEDGVQYADGVFIDITERKKTEEALRDREEKYRGIFDESIAAIYVFDEKKYFLDSNQAGLDMLGYSMDELLSMNISDVDANPVAVLPAHDQLISGEKIVNYEHQLKRKDGKIITVLNNSRPLTDSKGHVTGMQSTLIDITRRKKVEDALKRKEEKLSAIVDQSPIPTAVGGLDGSIISFNSALEELIGYRKSEITDVTDWANKLYPDKEYRDFVSNNIQQALRGEKQDFTEFEITCKDGSIRTVDFHTSFFMDGLIIQMVDVTERKRLEDQLRHGQKMKAVGTLSGGIAHEFNNLLYMISANAELLMDDARPEDTEMLQEIFNSTQRGANLVKQLLAFSRKSESNLQPTRINIEIRKIKKMLDRVLPRMIDMELYLSDDLYSIKADQSQIEQIVMNLCLNAKDAMPDGGLLIIKTENSVIDKTYIDKHPGKPKGLHEGKCVILTVSDTGFGMDKETRERIFDPFFTTKEIGEGTGLGLSVIYGIIGGHNGHISCESEVGVGTTFKIYFPVIEDDQVVSIPYNDDVQPLLKGTETILIVDDEEPIINVTLRMLERFGYKIITAYTGESALDIYTKKQNEIDLILLDLSMPGMGGNKCLEKLVEFDPDVKVLIASGYSDIGLIQDSINIGAKGYAVKPYTKNNISKAIREVLDKTA